MISQIVSAAPSKAITAPPQAASHEAGSGFADLVQQIMGEAAAAKTPAKSVPVPSEPVDKVPALAVTAGVTAVPVAPERDPKVPALETGKLESAALETPVDTTKPGSKTPAPVEDPVQVMQAAAPVPVKITETLPPPVSGGPVRGTRKADSSKSAQPAAPFVAVVIPIIVPSITAKSASSEPQAHSTPAPVGTADTDEAPATISAPPAVQVKIRSADPENPQNAAAPAMPVKVAPVPILATELPVTPVPAATAQPMPVIAMPVVTPSPVQSQPVTAKTAAQPSLGAQMDEPLSAEPKTQPLKSVSIEFSPDGAPDVRMRLSEHGGDVHISLHTADPSLSGRLNDGVKDLVDSLTTAGYDAQSWTPDEGRQNQRQAEEPRRTRNQGSGDPDAETFDSAMQQA